MGNKFVDGLRALSNERLFGMKSFASCWPIWSAEMESLTDDFGNEEEIFKLGAHLSDVFRRTVKKDETEKRDQSSVSGGGAAWEGLVCWYLNLIMIGSRGVCIKQSKSTLPPAISDAMTVSYKNKPTNTESDLTVIIFPKDIEILDDDFSKKKFFDFVSRNIGKFQAHNIQYKTNWNDNSQIPMLWDMIYQFSGARRNNVSIGRNGFSLSDLEDFTYSFVTVPSQKGEFKPGSMPVLRVESLTGGNYWGQPSQAHVSSSLTEIFKRNFAAAFDGDIINHVRQNVRNGRLNPRF